MRISDWSSDVCSSDLITVLRIAGSRLAVSGRRQRARDFAEAALQLGRKSELHARYAWVAFADIYHRLTSNVEAVIGIICSQLCDAAISNEQAWYEAEIFEDRKRTRLNSSH